MDSNYSEILDSIKQVIQLYREECLAEAELINT